jgi:hypothetical protein
MEKFEIRNQKFEMKSEAAPLREGETAGDCHLSTPSSRVRGTKPFEFLISNFEFAARPATHIFS